MPGLRVVVVLIAVSVPLFIGVEALLREYVLGPIYGPLLSDIRDLRWPELTNEVLAARATRFAWVMIGVTAVAGLTGITLLRRTVRRASEAAEPVTPAKLRDTLLLMTSIPQVPGLLAALALTFDPERLPVILCVALSTSFVIGQGFLGERLLERREEIAGPGGA